MKQVNNTLFAGLLALGLLTIQGCANNSKNSTPTESEEKEATEVVEEKKVDTFTTGKGEFMTDKVLEICYNDGISDGALDARTHNFHGMYGTEEVFKRNWVMAFGIADNDKAKDVYQRGLKRYIEAYKASFKECNTP